MGRRRGRLPGRQLPGRCGPSGTASTATPSATSGAARTPRSASSPAGSPARPTSTSTPAGVPFASINFVTAHDGFTLNDLVSYNEKHNEANGEGNNDGESHNRSWNCGVEGPTDDPEVLQLRAQQRRNFIATLMLSQGVPMLLHGDELGRTQGGNNNGYCQDSELTWIDWENVDEGLLEFTKKVTKLRTTTRRSAAAGSSTAARSAAGRATRCPTSTG